MPCTSSSLANFSEKYYIWAAAEAEGSAPEDFYTNCHYDEHYYDQQHYYNQPGRFITQCNALLVASYIGVECIGYKFLEDTMNERIATLEWQRFQNLANRPFGISVNK